MTIATLEERVRARARGEAEMDVECDFARVRMYAKTDEEIAALKTMEDRAKKDHADTAEARAVYRLTNWLNRKPSWLQRVMLGWQGFN